MRPLICKGRMKTYRRFLVEKDYVESFKSRGESVPPWIVLQPYVIRDSVPGYMVPCKENHPDAELQTSEESERND